MGPLKCMHLSHAIIFLSASCEKSWRTAAMVALPLCLIFLVLLVGFGVQSSKRHAKRAASGSYDDVKINLPRVPPDDPNDSKNTAATTAATVTNHDVSNDAVLYEEPAAIYTPLQRGNHDGSQHDYSHLTTRGAYENVQEGI